MPVLSQIRTFVPNAVTSLTIVLSVLAVKEAVAGGFETAAWYIVWCVLLDRVDGVAARLLDATSELGKQLDSLADMIAFGFVPAVMTYLLLTRDPFYAGYFAGWSGQTILLVSMSSYVLASAFRLARFNVTAEDLGSDWFQGLPTTIAAAIVMTFLLTVWRHHWPEEILLSLPILLLTAALLMISTFWLPKSLRWLPSAFLPSRRMRLLVLVPLVALVYGLGATMSMPGLLFALAVGYPGIGFLLGGLLHPDQPLKGELGPRDAEEG